jgi:hypothetical protein
MPGVASSDCVSWLEVCPILDLVEDERWYRVRYEVALGNSGLLEVEGLGVKMVYREERWLLMLLILGGCEANITLTGDL